MFPRALREANSTFINHILISQPNSSIEGRPIDLLKGLLCKEELLAEMFPAGVLLFGQGDELPSERDESLGVVAHELMGHWRLFGPRHLRKQACKLWRKTARDFVSGI